MGLFEKLKAKNQRARVESPVKIVFLGDSVTHGCFEVYEGENGKIKTVFDHNAVYHRQFQEMTAVLFPESPVSVINAGISGDSAPGGLERLERDVLACKPDMAVVCYGLNDAMGGLDKIGSFSDALASIFSALAENGIEALYMTPNMMNTYVSSDIRGEWLRDVAHQTAHVQNDGVLDAYVSAAKEVCQAHHVPVCDIYAKWKRLQALGTDTTRLLSNLVNHPTREMHSLSARSLVETIIFDTPISK